MSKIVTQYFKNTSRKIPRYGDKELRDYTHIFSPNAPYFKSELARTQQFKFIELEEDENSLKAFSFPSIRGRESLQNDLFFKVPYYKVEITIRDNHCFLIRAFYCFDNFWREFFFTEREYNTEAPRIFSDLEEIPPAVLNIFLNKGISLESIPYICEDIFKTTDQSLVKEKNVSSDSYYYNTGYKLHLRRVTDFSQLKGKI